MNHKYACQNKTQELLNHMYPIPAYFAVDPKFLIGVNEQEFINGFRCLWNVINKMYMDIIVNPESYGLPCTEDYDPNKGAYSFDKKRADSGNSSRRLMKFLKVLCHSGELQSNRLVIPFNIYEENLKALKPKSTKAASFLLIKRLIDFGFNFNGFNGESFDKNIDSFDVSFKGNEYLLPFLKGYSLAECREDKFCVLHYDVIAKTDSLPKPICAFVFSQYLTGVQREFFEKFNRRMMDEGFVCITSFQCPFDVEYYRKQQLSINKDKPFVVRCSSKNNQLDIMMRMMGIENYIDRINSLPEHIKLCYKTARCRNCFGDWRECVSMRRWTIDSETFSDCQWGDGAHISEFNIDDVELYIETIKLESNEKRYGRK